MLHLNNSERFMLCEVVLASLVVVWLWIRAKSKRGSHYEDRLFPCCASTFFAIELAVALLALFRWEGIGDRSAVVGSIVCFVSIFQVAVFETAPKYYDRQPWREDRYIGWRISFGRVDQILGEPVRTSWWHRFGFCHYVSGLMIQEISCTGNNGTEIWLELVLKATSNIGPKDFQGACDRTIEQCCKVADEIVNYPEKKAEELLSEFLRQVDDRVDVDLRSPSLYPLVRLQIQKSAGV